MDVVCNLLIMRDLHQILSNLMTLLSQLILRLCVVILILQFHKVSVSLLYESMSEQMVSNGLIMMDGSRHQMYEHGTE